MRDGGYNLGRGSETKEISMKISVKVLIMNLSRCQKGGGVEGYLHFTIIDN